MSVLSLLEVGSKLPQILGSSPGEMASRLPDLVRSMGSDSLVEFTQSTQVSPKCVVDAALSSNPNLSAILKTCNILVGSYYLMAVSIMLRHDGVQISEILDAVNPNRNVGDSVARSAGALLSGLNSDAWDSFALPRFDAASKEMQVNENPYLKYLAATDAGLNADKPVNGKASDSVEAHNNDVNGMQLHKDMVNTLYGAGNLGTGTMIDVVFESRNNGKISVPVMINVEVNMTASASVVDILSHAEKDLSMKERAWQWRNGLISSWEFLTAVDVIDAHAAALRRDTTGLYAELRNRKKKNSAAGFLAGLASLKRGLNNSRPNGLSVATASNIVVMDKITAQNLERQIGGVLSDVRVRNRIFVNSYVMMLFVVDSAWDTVTVYIRGHAQGSDYKMSDIKSVSSKGNSAELIALGEAAMSKLTTPSLSGSRFG